MSLADLSPSDAGRGVFIRKQTANIYTVLLILSFLFIAVGCLFFFLEMKSYDLSIKVTPEAKVPPPLQPDVTQVDRTSAMPRIAAIGNFNSPFTPFI
jgi:hypothetical protein